MNRLLVEPHNPDLNLSSGWLRKLVWFRSSLGLPGKQQHVPEKDPKYSFCFLTQSEQGECEHELSGDLSFSLSTAAKGPGRPRAVPELRWELLLCSHGVAEKTPRCSASSACPYLFSFIWHPTSATPLRGVCPLNDTQNLARSWSHPAEETSLALL